MTNLILCPLKKELQALLAALPFSTDEQTANKQHRYQTFKNTAFALCGVGKAEAAVRTSFWIERLQPKNIILCGTAGRLDPSLELYQAIIAEKTIEHDLKNLFVASKLPEFAGHPSLLTKLSGPFFTIASGDEDVTNLKRGQEIRDLTGAACVAWEGAGVARACKFYSKNFLEIRAISDFADNTAAADFTNQLDQAMASVAKPLQKLL